MSAVAGVAVEHSGQSARGDRSRSFAFGSVPVAGAGANAAVAWLAVVPFVEYSTEARTSMAEPEAREVPLVVAHQRLDPEPQPGHC